MNDVKFKKFVDYLYSVRDYDYFADFMRGITSDKDKQNLPKRVEIVKKLLAGENHHDIAEELGVGVATVTKGSKLVNQGYFKVRKTLVSSRIKDIGNWEQGILGRKITGGGMCRRCCRVSWRG